MLNPQPARLLGRVADALAETVLPTMDRGLARNQVMAAIGIVRRCAAAVDTLGPIVHAECVDLVQSLRSISTADPDLVIDRPAAEAALEEADAVLAESYPSVPALTEAALSLQAVLAGVAVTAEQQGSDQLPAIRGVLERMTDRQLNLGLSPW